MVLLLFQNNKHLDSPNYKIRHNLMEMHYFDLVQVGINSELFLRHILYNNYIFNSNTCIL